MNIKELSFEFLFASLPRIFYLEDGKKHYLSINLNADDIRFSLVSCETMKEAFAVEHLEFRAGLFLFLGELKNRQIYDYVETINGIFVWNDLNPVDEKAKFYAEFWHSQVNQFYDGEPYSVHLQSVVKYAKKYLHLIPENDRKFVVAACWLHDTVEDCRKTYNDNKLLFGETVANIVYALSNEKGRNRAERANAKYYQGINNTLYAPFCKICDRLANVEYSKSVQSSMLQKYKKENKSFVAHFEQYKNEYGAMFNELESLFI